MVNMPSLVILRAVTPADLPIFFEHQCDPDAATMAAFPAREREAFMAHWAKILADPANITQAIVADGQVVGNIACYPEGGQFYIGYWIGQAYWGKGIATQALAMLLDYMPMRPLYAYVAKHNVASLRVLHKCGFTISSENLPDSEPHPDQIEEFLLRLDAAPAGK